MRSAILFQLQGDVTAVSPTSSKQSPQQYQRPLTALADGEVGTNSGNLSTVDLFLFLLGDRDARHWRDFTQRVDMDR